MNPMIALLLFVAMPAPTEGRISAAAADRGEVKAGPTLTHKFTIVNRGTDALVVSSLEAGCGCVSAAVTKPELRPGESTELTVDVNTLTQPAGPNVWRVVVRYNTYAAAPPAAPPGQLPAPRLPSPGEAVFRVSANLVREVSVTPPSVAISSAGEAKLSLVVSDTRGKPLRVTKAVTSSPHLAAIVRPPQERAGAWWQAVELTLGADAPAGHRNEIIVLYTDDPVYPELRVPASVTKRSPGAVTASPDAVVLRFATGQAEAAAVAVLRAGGAAVKVERAECDTPGVQLKWSVGKGPTATLRVTVPCTGTGKADVRILFAEPAGHTLILPVTWGPD